MKYSPSDKRGAIATYFRLNSFRKASAVLDIPSSTISSCVSKIGHKCIDKRKGSSHPNRQSKIGDQIQPLVRDMLLESQYLTISEVHSQLLIEHGITCSLSSVYRAKDAIGMSRKRASKLWFGAYGANWPLCGHTPPVDDEKRKQIVDDFSKAILEIPIQNVISVDESSFDSRMIPFYGYSFKGKQLKPQHFTKTSLSRNRLSLIYGVACDGVKGKRIVNGSANTTEFINFLEETLPKCQSQSHVLLDNISFHKNDKVLEVIKKHGKIPIYTPPYCPMYNPIEHVFSRIKKSFREVRAMVKDTLSIEQMETFLMIWEAFTPRELYQNI